MSNVKAAKDAYEAFARGDLASLNFAEDVVWVTSDELPLGGVIKGRDDVYWNFAQIPNYWSEFELTPERFIDGGDTVVVTGTIRATGNGGKLEDSFFHIIDFRGDQPVRGEFHIDTAKALRALGE